MKKTILHIFFLLTSLNGLAQQDPLYNQYFFNPLVINPAYAGIHSFASVTLLSRTQYLGMEGAPITNNLSFNTSFFSNRAGIGLMVINDRLGVNDNYEFVIPYSYKIDFGNASLSMGIQGSYTLYQYDYTKLNLEYLDDESFVPDSENFGQANFGAGFLVHSDFYFFGASIPRILDVDVTDGVVSSSRYRRHLYALGGVIIPLVNGFKIKPSFLVKSVENNPFSVDLNLNVLVLETLWVGISSRNFNAFGGNAQLELNDQFRFGYSFEFATNPLSRSNFGTHELMLAVDFSLLGKHFVQRRYY